VSSCNKCKDTGFVPFYRKDGTLVPGIRVHCECYEERSQYIPYSEDMIDFPVSYDWHRHYQSYYGQPDPGQLEPQVHTMENPCTDGRGDKALEEYKSMFRSLNQRVRKLEAGYYKRREAYARQEKKPQPQGYTGLKEE